MVMTQAVVRGKVWHQRKQPFRHGFAYPLWLVWCDLDEIPQLLSRHWSWGSRWRPVVFRSEDFVDRRALALAEKVREKVAEHGLDWSAGRVIMLGQWRTFGTLFNPLVLYFHFAEGADQPDAMLAEVQNTPWREKHFYALSLEANEHGELLACHRKGFHVSPFLPMALDYHWRLHVALPELRLVLEDRRGEETVFTAGLQLQLQAPCASNLGRVVWRFGAQGLATLGGIYWQAWRLWRKGARFHPHPKTEKGH